jgi:hypothetical protein
MQRAGSRAQLSIACRHFNDAYSSQLSSSKGRVIIKPCTSRNLNLFIFIYLRADLRAECLIKKIP